MCFNKTKVQGNIRLHLFEARYFKSNDTRLVLAGIQENFETDSFRQMNTLETEKVIIYYYYQINFNEI